MAEFSGTTCLELAVLVWINIFMFFEVSQQHTICFTNQHDVWPCQDGFLATSPGQQKIGYLPIESEPPSALCARLAEYGGPTLSETILSDNPKFTPSFTVSFHVVEKLSHKGKPSSGALIYSSAKPSFGNVRKRCCRALPVVLNLRTLHLFNTLSYVVVFSYHKIFRYHFIIVISLLFWIITPISVMQDIRYMTAVKWLSDPQRGCDRQVENH